MESDMDVFMRRIDTNPLDLLLDDPSRGQMDSANIDPDVLIKEIKDEIIVFVKWVANGLTSLEVTHPSPSPAVESGSLKTINPAQVYSVCPYTHPL